MKISDIQNLHTGLGGVYTGETNSFAPDYYTNRDSEQEFARKESGVVDLSGRGKLEISGRDHVKLLQGMTTNDMEKLGAGRGAYATALSVKGRMVADMHAFKFEDRIILDLERGLNINLAEHLIKYRLSYKADIEDLTETLLHYHICGPASPGIIETIFNIPAAGMNEYDILNTGYGDTQLFIVKLNRTGETGFDLIADIQISEELLTTILNNDKIKPFGTLALDTLRIEAGKPVFGIDMDEDNIPIEAGLWSALDFEKGCYIGQEVIARIKWRGRVNWHLVGFKSSGEKEIPVGSKIFNESKEIGRITSTTFSRSLNNHIALGYIRREFNEENQPVLIQTAENSFLNAVVCKLPFINNFK